MMERLIILSVIYAVVNLLIVVNENKCAKKDWRQTFQFVLYVMWAVLTADLIYVAFCLPPK